MPKYLEARRKKEIRADPMRKGDPVPQSDAKIGEMEQKQLPPQENLNLHGMDSEAERGSGWTLQGIDMKKAKLKYPDPGQDAFVKDGGAVNRAQEERIKNAQIPLTDELAKHIPLDVATNSLPDYESQGPGEVAIVYPQDLIQAAGRDVPMRSLNEAQKMGLTTTNTEQQYQTTARMIRGVDAQVSLGILPAMAFAPMQTASNAMQVGFLAGNTPTGNVFPGKIAPNPYVIPAVAYDTQFSPPTAPAVSPDMIIPGCYNQCYTARQDSFAANELEKLVVVNPMAYQNALDSTIFSPYFRNLSQIPQIARQYLTPSSF